uniref:Uncharacterized protein n=1 Tax=Anguilla anguilla TaxID=7936 RepID=A0A0E9SX64_ANGAN
MIEIGLYSVLRIVHVVNISLVMVNCTDITQEQKFKVT